MSNSNIPNSQTEQLPTEGSRKSTFPFIIAMLLVLLIITVMCAYQLKSTEVAIITTFGKPKLITNPGLHPRLPWPMQRIVRLDRRVRLFTGSPRETMTRDNTNLIISLWATWSIAEPLLYFNSVGSKHEAESILKSLIESKQEAVIRGHDFVDFLSTDSNKVKFERIEEEILSAVQKQALNTYGIGIDFIGLAQLNLNESATASVFERMKQEQVKIVAEIRSEGEKESKIIRDNADSLKAQKLAQSEAEAKRIRGQAMIKAAEQYDEFKEDLDFAIFLRKLDALEETMKTKTTIILDPKTPPYDLLQLESKEFKTEKQRGN